ncbi:MAG: hypothetical protein AB2693_34810, partial [Candidatus Thiodiazotropha sp.]
MAHVRAKHEKQTLNSCSKCHKMFDYHQAVTRHERTCNGTIFHDCAKCKKRCSTAHGLRRHLQWHQKARHTKSIEQNRRNTAIKARPTPPATKRKATTQARPNNFRCRRCSKVFNNRHDLYLHGRKQHYNQFGGALQPRPWGRDEVTPFADDVALREVYEANAPLILEQHRRGPIHSVYNFPLSNDVNLNQLMGYADDIYRQQQRAFRLNLMFGMILQNRETGRYRYFVPYSNNGIFDRPLYISKRVDLQRFRYEMERKDIMNEILRNRPDTQWIPVLVTNVHFLVTETYYPIGQGHHLPDYLMKKDSVFPLVKNQQTRKYYKDNLCAFRCLALHRGCDIMSLEGPAKQLYQQWSEEPRDTFEGISMDQFPTFENTFGVNLEVYELLEDGFALPIYKSLGKHSTTMYVNLYENHMSYIRNFSQYAQKYQCQSCQRHFDHAGNLHKHQKTCINKTQFVYPGG